MDINKEYIIKAAIEGCRFNIDFNYLTMLPVFNIGSLTIMKRSLLNLTYIVILQ